MSFPEIEDERAVRQMLRHGLTIDAQRVNGAVKNQLSDLGLIEVEESRYLICADSDYPVEDRHPDPTCRVEISFEGREAIHECDACGNSLHGVEEDRPVYTKYTFRQKPEGIFDHLRLALSNLQTVDDVDVAGRGALEVHLSDDRELVVAIPEWTEQQFLMRGPFFSDPTLYVHAKQLKELPTVLEEAHHIQFADLLTTSSEEITKRLEMAATPIPDRPSLQELVKRFDAVVERHVETDNTSVQGDFFEYFFRDLVRHIQDRPEVVNDYLQSLRRIRKTVFGEMHFQVGGSGKTDVVAVNKFELMNQLFRSGAIADTKCYRSSKSSKIEEDDLWTIKKHLDTSPWGANYAIVVLANEDVSDSAWDYVARLRQSNDEWVIMLIPKCDLIELIHEVDAEHLLDAVMDEDRTDLFYPGDDRYEEIVASRA